MKAAVFDQYQTELEVRTVPDPEPHPDSVIIQVTACGICRSDWHGWMGHDSDVRLPHVPGHELAGRIAALGSEVRCWSVDQRVTAPFCCGCGSCRECRGGHPHICDNYTQPGFTQWGAFAEYVEIRHADVNLVALPDDMADDTAASLGCRFATAFRGIIDQGQLTAGESAAVYGCGGVGLSAVMIARAAGAHVTAVDIAPARLQLASELGADCVIQANRQDPVDAIRDLSDGGVHVSVDALGSRQTCEQSVRSLRKRGRHVQIGLTLGSDTNPPVPMSDVIAKELVLLGSHGMQASEYPRMLSLIKSAGLQPERLIRDRVSLETGAALLPQMDQFPGDGVTIICQG